MYIVLLCSSEAQLHKSTILHCNINYVIENTFVNYLIVSWSTQVRVYSPWSPLHLSGTHYRANYTE